MSHFTCLVVTNSPEEVDAALQPFHEFECTGTDDEYVQDVDITEEARALFDSQTTGMLRDPDGVLHAPYDDRFYRDPTDEEAEKIGIGGSGLSDGLSWHSRDWADGKGYRAKVRFIPEGWEEVEVPTKETENFAEFIKGYYGLPVKSETELSDSDKERDPYKYGYILLTVAGEVEKAIDRTNPNKKWDWWTVGGRWSGSLCPNYDAASDPDNQQTCWLCAGTGRRDDALGKQTRAANPSYTCNGCQGTGSSQKCPTKWKDMGNQSRVGDLDFDALKADAVKHRSKTVEEIRVRANAADLVALDRMYRAYCAADKIWQALPEPRPRGDAFVEWLKAQQDGEPAAAYYAADLWRNIKVPEGMTVSGWTEAAPALSTFALLKDGEWFERGEMGWWGAVHGEKPEGEWEAEFAKMLAALPPDKWVTVVDCHI